MQEQNGMKETERKALLAQLVSILGEDRVRTDEPMAQHTSFRIGGPADFFVTPHTAEEIQQLVRYLRAQQIPFYVIGNGSNLLVSDAGYRGVIIALLDNFAGMEILHEGPQQTDAVDKASRVYVRAQAGMKLGTLGGRLADNSLQGFEFATGIPGTIGGAVMMNAGAYGGEMKDVLIRATVLDRESNIRTLTAEELELGYRTSSVAREGYLVLDAVLCLQPGNSRQIRDRIQELAQKRREKQPLEYPSAGSTFKRPEGYFAGKLISDAGLKGYTVGGAQVSEKHAGFVINTGHATAADVIRLTDEVRKRIQQKDGVTLELEVRKLGFE